jgi:hypothetical protein
MSEFLVVRRSAGFQTGLGRMRGFADGMQSSRQVVELRRIRGRKHPLTAAPFVLRFPLSRPP